ncbi:uroporphyrinogen-III C-methyltransferase [Pseudidiomarina insulisalsae]|uniref:Heme biosynthesis operon protein HemX n=1 Tax=Pseudidiomarina insulisalsae TaxID=575789 RepID=A0A432YQW3_9GAMM|nr:uroporphyrinogen-III C-methyltransferase [Pseudidiomarina insulisalsae]RUO63775.1 hypothetical protein CWI71_01550 [Pseudidiomarina insulisalsae]
MSNETKSTSAELPEELPDEAKQPKPERKASLAAWLTIIILLAALIAAGWVGYRYVYQDLLASNQQLVAQSEEQARQLKELRSELEQQVQQLRRQQQELPATIEQQLQQNEQGVRRSLSQQAQTQADLERAVQAVQAELASLDVSQATAWRVLEARQLVAEASTKLYIDQEPQLALQLLDLADTHLAALNNPAYQAARQAINDDKVALRAIDADQHLQVAMELNSLRARLLQQQWRLQAPGRTVSAKQPPPDAPWYEHLSASAGALFDQLIRVQHLEKPIQPQLSAAFVELAKQRVLMQLQLAQQAALSQHDELFQRSIQEALALVTELENESDLNLAALSTDLTQLAAQSLQPSLPDQLRSLAIMNRHAEAINAGAGQ